MMDLDEDIFAGFDLEEMRALEDGDLSLFSNLLDPSFRIGSNSAGGSDSNPSPTSITPSSAEELALALGIDEDDPKMINTNFMAFKSPNKPANAHYNEPNPMLYHNNNNSSIRNENPPKTLNDNELSVKTGDEPPAPPPLVVCPIEVGKASITLQKNQLCACKECGKLFKSIWYLKQHAVRHSNERPFKCNYCHKAFKFRSNLYQHNCLAKHETNRAMRNTQPTGAGINPMTKKRFYTRGIAYTEQYGASGQLPSANNNNKQGNEQMPQSVVDEEQFQQLLYNNPIQAPQQQMAGFGAQPSIGATMQSLDPNFTAYGAQQPMPFDLKTEMDVQQMGQQFGDQQQALVENNSIRNKPLNPEYIDSYLQKNRHRIHSCKKCKINFPYREYLVRHLAFHADVDNHSFGCDQCPQRFSTGKQLESHLQKHADDSPHRCFQCNAGFRSALALRRHKDQCRKCYCPSFGIYPQQQISPNAIPLDQYAFIDSDVEEEDPLKNLGLNRQKSTADSGMGSDSSTHSYTTSPISNRTGMDDEIDHHQSRIHHPNQQSQYVPTGPNTKSPHEKNGKDDETDSGFRSRLNSTTQSCSPGSSSFSSESGESPSRKFSKTGPHHPHEHQMHQMPNDYSNGSQYHHHSNSTNQMNYQTNVGYHQRQQMSGHSNIQYDGVSGNNWSQFSGFQSLSNNYSRPELSNGPMDLLLAPAEFGSSFLSGKAMPSFIERFEMMNIVENEALVEEPASFDQNQQPYWSDVEVADPEQIVQEAVRLFARRFLAVFLNTVISIGQAKAKKEDC